MIENGIKLIQGFTIGSTQSIDTRLVLSADDITKVGAAEYQSDPNSNYNLGRWPDHYFFICEDDGQMYEFHKDASAPNGCVITRITRKLDGITILEDLDQKAYVPIDNKSIKVEGGKLVAVKEPLMADGVATHLYYDGDSERVDVLFDDKSIKVIGNKLYVNVDAESIKLDSEGHLYVDFTLLPDNVTIKQDANGKLVAQYKVADKKGLKLDGVAFEVLVDDNTIHFDSEGKLTADFIRYIGSEGVSVEGNKISAVVDDKTVKVGNEGLEVRHSGAVGLGSEGLFVKHDGHTVVLNANKELRVPIQDLVHVDNPFELDKTVADEVTLKLKHDDSLEVTSEGKLHAVARQAVASEGIIVVPVGETSQISADFDHKTIVLGSEGMEVALKEKGGLKYATGTKKGLEVMVDGATVTINSEGKLVSTSTPLDTILPIKKVTDASGRITLSLEYDNKTIKNGSEGIYVPIDKDSIFIDTDNKIKAKRQVYPDGLTILEDSEHKFRVNIDNKTLTSEGGVIETVIGGWIENPTTVHFINTASAPATFTPIGGGIYRYEGTIGSGFSPVPADGQAVRVDLTPKAGTIPATVSVVGDYTFIDYGTYISTGDGSPTDELVNLNYEKVTGKFTIDIRPTDATIYQSVNNLDLDVYGTLGVYHPIDAKFVPVDGTSIIIKNGALSTSAPSITAGAGLEYTITPTANILDVLTESESIMIRGDKLYVPVLADHTSAEEDLVLTINSEGKPEFLKRAGVVDVVIDSESIVSDYVATIPDATDTKRGVVKFDNDTIVLNSEGQIKVVRLVEDVLVKEITSEGTSEESVVENRVAHVDLTPYSKLNETAYRVELLMDGHHADSEADYDSESNFILSVNVYDQDDNLLTTSNVIDFPMEKAVTGVSSRLGPPDCEGIRETILVFHFITGNEVEIPLGSIASGYITQRGNYTGVNSIYGIKNFQGELLNYGYEVITQGQMDEKTTFWDDSEQVLKAILPDGHKAIELKDLGTKYEYNVLYDEETILLNSENELYVPLDKKTIIISEGKVAANIDNETIIYDDSEKVIKLPIDNVTITLNSEGFLEASGLDVKPGDAIEISTSEEDGLPVKYIDVKFDEATVVLDSEGKLSVPIDKDSIIINSEAMLEVDQYTAQEIRTLWHAICVEGEI